MRIMFSPAIVRRQQTKEGNQRWEPRVMSRVVAKVRELSGTCLTAQLTQFPYSMGLVEAHTQLWVSWAKLGPPTHDVLLLLLGKPFVMLANWANVLKIISYI